MFANLQVKEKLVVPMRMQWWRDAVNGIYKAKPIKHPAVQCLHQVRAGDRLTKVMLCDASRVRTHDLSVHTFPAWCALT